MLRNIFQSGCKLITPRHSRTVHCSAANCSQFDDDKPKKMMEEKEPVVEDQEYWETDVEPEHPVGRTYRVMSHQMRQIKEKLMFWREPRPVDVDEWGVDSSDFPLYTDVVVVGGGMAGSSVAYWLKKLTGETFTVIVVEKDPDYSRNPFLMNGFRQQFSLEENIEMSLFGAEFIRDAYEYLSVNKQPVNIPFSHNGSLLLATEEGAEILLQNSKLQNRKGAKNIVLTAEKLKERFPWMNTEGIAAGCLGLEREGWFDPWYLLHALRRKNLSMGVEYATAEVKGFIFERTPNLPIIPNDDDPTHFRKINNVVVKAADGSKKVIRYAMLVIAAGAQSGEVAKLAKVGHCKGSLSIPLYTEPRKRFMYHFHAPDGPLIDTPMVIDPSGTYFRREGLANYYSVGRSPSSEEEELPIDNLEVDHEYFQQKILPELTHRVPNFKNLKVVASHAGFYDYNRYDGSPIIGQHPLYRNLLFCTGFSGHGIQQAPAAGRALAELMVYSGYRSLDLTRLSFERFVTDEPMYEQLIL